MRSSPSGRRFPPTNVSVTPLRGEGSKCRGGNKLARLNSVKMTRGNQRDHDRARAQKKAAEAAKGKQPKMSATALAAKREADAEAIRKKAAERAAQKAAAEAAGGGAANNGKK